MKSCAVLPLASYVAFMCLYPCSYCEAYAYVAPFDGDVILSLQKPVFEGVAQEVLAECVRSLQFASDAIKNKKVGW